MDVPREIPPTKDSFSSKAATYHEKIPGLRKLPFSVVAVIVSVFVVNILVWSVVGVVLVSDLMFLGH